MQTSQTSDDKSADERGEISRVEDTRDFETVPADKEDAVYRDRHGFALIPQPTGFRDDPLVRAI